MLWNLCLPSFFRLRCSASRQRLVVSSLSRTSKTTSRALMPVLAFSAGDARKYAIWSWEVLYWVNAGRFAAHLGVTYRMSWCHHFLLLPHQLSQGAVQSGRELVLSPISDTQYLYQSFTNCKGFASAINVIDQACTHACFAHWLVTATLTCLAVLECLWSTEVIVKWFTLSDDSHTVLEGWQHNTTIPQIGLPFTWHKTCQGSATYASIWSLMFASSIVPIDGVTVPEPPSPHMRE